MTPFDAGLLAQTLTLIEEIDPSANGTEGTPDAAERYAIRNRLVWGALAIATRGGYDCGVALDPDEPDWPVVYIELPTGQVSWHLPCWNGEWDGHNGATKAERIRAFAAAPESVTFADRRAVADPSVDLKADKS